MDKGNLKDLDLPVEGLFIPGKEVRLYAVAPKRKENFLAVYPEAISDLAGPEIETFLRLLLLADFRNRVRVSRAELAMLFNLKVEGVKWRIRQLHGKAFKGRVPNLFLNPFYGSKCSATLLKEIRCEWMEMPE